MSKIKVCKNAVNYDGIIKALKDNKYISAKSVERLIEKL